ncbi:hypothetical protein S7711_04219 [Stachybotrys chartarum IBT 7711]|uniref:Succinate-semialdehyde dehydrogenase, mitochondrial n=1 Tax=Stachybotrys chartarum (strain CBS 109288 / IBT 7711) TaxID=1280523 RepID=A0A084AIK1_STACB|nr:hypothetical protein S7711_04219 [Stachybotrys chartarum IBT 7711]
MAAQPLETDRAPGGCRYSRILHIGCWNSTAHLLLFRDYVVALSLSLSLYHGAPRQGLFSVDDTASPAFLVTGLEKSFDHGACAQRSYPAQAESLLCERQLAASQVWQDVPSPRFVSVLTISPPPQELWPSCFLLYENSDMASVRGSKDPATGNVIGSCAECDVDDTNAAIQAAADALPSFRKTTGRERARLLRRWYDLMVDNSEDLATLITWENGKPLADAKGEAAYAASFFEWFSEEAPRTYGETIPATVPGNRVWTVKEPVGVCGLITPWNFPAAMITRKIGPALAAGCTVVCKAPGETPYTSLALAELAHRAGIPKGVVNVVSSLDNTPAVGQALTTSPIVKKVSFTGSTGVGKLLMKQSSDSLKKLSFELGGNAPFIVFDDADIDAAVAGAIASKFRSSGQTCVCANRIYVQEGIYDDFVAKFTDKVRGFKVGRPFDEGVTHGPLIHDRAVSKVQAHIRDAESKGATVTVGGQLLPDLGANFVQPTVIRDMTADMALASEETFGPVAGLFPFRTEEEVVALANRAEVGLAGYFFSRDLERVYRVAESLEVGMVGVNTGLISDPAAPFGGVKHSGFGREGSLHGISEYQPVEKQMTARNGTSTRLQPPSAPYLIAQLQCVFRNTKLQTPFTWKSASSPSPTPCKTLGTHSLHSMALPRGSASALRGVRLFASSQRFTVPSVTRTLACTPHLCKKRKIAPASNSPSSSPEPPSSSKSSKASPSDADDPLDFSSVISAFKPIDVHFKAQLQTLLHGGRFNPANLGALPVNVKDADADGGGLVSFPLRELAQIVPRAGRTISLLLNDRDYVKPIMSAVQASPEFNQQPQRSEDNELELLLKIELERKDDVARRAKEMAQAWRERIRQVRAKHEKKLKDLKKSGGVLPDTMKKAEKELQKLQDAKMKEIDQDEAQTIKQIGRNSS